MKFYVYLIFDDANLPLYVGKGSGKRSFVSSKKFGGKIKILESFSSESKAYQAERKWIKQLKPTHNKCPGGNGSRAKKIGLRKTKDELEMERIGTRKFAARFLMRKLSEQNIHLYGVSSESFAKIKQVAELQN